MQHAGGITEQKGARCMPGADLVHRKVGKLLQAALHHTDGPALLGCQLIGSHQPLCYFCNALAAVHTCTASACLACGIDWSSNIVVRALPAHWISKKHLRTSALHCMLVLIWHAAALMIGVVRCMFFAQDQPGTCLCTELPQPTWDGDYSMPTYHLLCTALSCKHRQDAGAAAHIQHCRPSDQCRVLL